MTSFRFIAMNLAFALYAALVPQRILLLPFITPAP